MRQVLVLQSFDRGNLILDHFTTNLRVNLDQRVGGPVNYIQVIVGRRVCRRAGDIGRRLHSLHLCRSSRPDLIVTIAGPAAVFAREYRQQLFPETPILFASIDQRYLPNSRWARTRPRSRSSTIGLGSSMTSCRCGPRPGRCSW